MQSLRTFNDNQNLHMVLVSVCVHQLCPLILYDLHMPMGTCFVLITVSIGLAICIDSVKWFCRCHVVAMGHDQHTIRV